jgi:hypothetical protein
MASPRKRGRIESASRAEEAIWLVRRHACESHGLAGKRNHRSPFGTEYGAALLYFTLRTIGYGTTSPLKRALAVHGAAELIRLFS